MIEQVSWSPAVIRKAEALISDGRVKRDLEHPLVFWVQGSQRYRVQTDGHLWMTCTCPNGMNQSQPHCYHSAAVLMVIRDMEQVELDDDVRWKVLACPACGTVARCTPDFDFYETGLWGGPGERVCENCFRDLARAAVVKESDE